MTTDALPRWDLTDVFPSLTSREFVAASESFGAEIDRLIALYDQVGVNEGNTSPHGIDDIIVATNAVHETGRRLGTYISSVVTTDSFDADGQRAQSELSMLSAQLTRLGARFTAWVGACGADTMAGAGTVAAEHRWPLRRTEARAQHQMSAAEEDFYAELAPTGSRAWNRLHGDVTSQLSTEVPGHGRLPMAAVRGLADHIDPDVREAAYRAELASWPTVAVTLGHALNAIKGEANVVNQRRKWGSPLDASLYANSVDRPTYEAMQAAVRSALPDFRRWMHTKARLHGYEGGLKWSDLFAPLPLAPASVTWDEGCTQVTSAFAAYSPSLGRLATQAMEQRWIDAGPRAGKQGGAFCASLEGERSIVQMNWAGSTSSVSTLAHELGHAYHNVQLAFRTPMQKALPMALAETASIFCETLLVEHGLQQATGAARLALLDADLVGSSQVVVDIFSRVLFETELFARRQKRSLTPEELCDMMTEAQDAAYGDGLSVGSHHPYMWAVKPHYYGSHFYNWPYTFGLLFGLGLHAVYQADPERFRSGYDDLLSSVGMDDAASLGRRFDIAVDDEAFWQASLDVVRKRITDYESLAASVS